MLKRVWHQEVLMAESNYFNLGLSRGLALQLGRWHTLWQRPQLLTFARCYYTEAALISKAAFEDGAHACVCV
jgi:hypothetical protein